MKKRTIKGTNLVKVILYTVFLLAVSVIMGMKGLEVYGQTLDLLEQTGTVFSSLHLKMYLYDALSIGAVIIFAVWVNYVYKWVHRGEKDLLDLIVEKMH